MTTISAKELRDNLDSIVQRARNGEKIRVTYRGKAAFIIQPEPNLRQPRLKGLKAFLAAPKQPIPFDQDIPMKELYRASIASKHSH